MGLVTGLLFQISILPGHVPLKPYYTTPHVSYILVNQPLSDYQKGEMLVHQIMQVGVSDNFPIWAYV